MSAHAGLVPASGQRPPLSYRGLEDQQRPGARIADLSTKLAEQAIFLAEKPELQSIPFDLAGMVSRAATMLRQLDSLVGLDIGQAQEVLVADDEVDGIHASMYASVIQAMRQNPQNLEQYIHMINISLDAGADRGLCGEHRRGCPIRRSR